MSSEVDELKVYVLRLGHREARDKRATTHLFLAARAFGADRAIYTGQTDPRLQDTICKVTKSWGGTFGVEQGEDWKEVVKAWKTNGGEVIHLTMYGLPILDVIDVIRESPRDKLVVVGGMKVPQEVFRLADWNISVTHQPHSEISALSVFLHEFFQGKELSKSFIDADMEIVPQARGKKVIRKKPESL